VKKLVVLTSVLALGGSLGVAALHAGSAPSFTGHKNYATGRDTSSVAIGDLNGDGRPDLATANGRPNTVSVLLNRGDGNFQARRHYATGRGPVSVAIGDLNDDGKPDLATANFRANTVSMLRNRGDGAFEAKLDYATGGAPVSVAIGDLNADGKPDLATANGNPTHTVSVLLNSGDGSFQAGLDYATGNNPREVAIGDLNGDGKPDLAIANSFAATVSVLLNRGDGSFRAKRDYRTGSATWSVAIGDLNGDGKPDLASANYEPDCVPVDYITCPGSNTVSVLLNRGNGSFRARRDFRTGLGPSSVAIGDLNGDGRPDLATANSEFLVNTLSENTLSVLANTGSSGFQARLDYRTGRNPGSVAIDDLNGDGKSDLATANDANTISVLLNRPGLCTVQGVYDLTLPAAKHAIARAHCRVGEVRRIYMRFTKKGRVISQKPRAGTVLPAGGKVDLVVSRGRRAS